MVAPDKAILEIAQSANPKLEIIKKAGDLNLKHVREDLVLVGIYIRPEKTRGGIIRPVDNLKEDIWQGKVGLVLKKGPDARGGTVDVEVGEWVVTDVKEAWPLQVGEAPCRLVPYDRIRMVIDNPEEVF